MLKKDKKMMKIRKGFALLLCVLMICGTSVTVFGANNVTVEDSYSFTINNLKGATQIDLYRVVKIDEQKNDVLAYAMEDKYEGMYDELGASEVADIEAKTNAEILDACKAANIRNLDPDKKVSVADQTDSYTFEDLEMGYYYVVMTGPDGTIYNPILWTVPTFVENDEGELIAYTDSTVTAKAHDPGIEKEVKEAEQWGEKADADIGDVVEYKLTVDVPKYAPNIESEDVIYKIVDNMEKGLAWLNEEPIVVKGYAGSNEEQGTVIDDPLKAAAAVTIDPNTKATTLTMTFDYGKIKEYAYITVEYKAMLNSDAELGETGNVNEATFIYSDNAYDITEYNESKKDSTTVYTYGLDLLKAELGNDDIVLKGAKFQLEKGNETYKFIKNNDGTYTALSSDLNGTATNAVDSVVSDEIVSDKNGKIIINGLDAGEYTLVETDAPENYFVIDEEIEIVITGESIQATGLTGLVVTGGESGNEAPEAGVYFVKTIYNSTQYVLPNTGEKGFVIMMICGITMLATACVMLLMKRKRFER